MKFVKFQETCLEKKKRNSFCGGGGVQEKQIEAAGINMQLIILFVKCDRSWFWSADITHMFCMKEHYA